MFKEELLAKTEVVFSGTRLLYSNDSAVIAAGSSFEKIIPTRNFIGIGGAVKVDQVGSFQVIELPDTEGVLEGPVGVSLSLLASTPEAWDYERLYSPRVKIVLTNNSGSDMNVSFLSVRGRSC